MPFAIDYGQKIPMGFAAEPALKGSTTAKVSLLGFFSTEDGDTFISYLDGISQMILNRIPLDSRPRESSINHLAMVLRRDGKATVYIDELNIIAKIRANRTLKAGETVLQDDITDISEVDCGIDIPADAALILLVSVGWRKGLYFDFTPISPESPTTRAKDYKIILAEIFAYLAFQDRLKITDSQWTELFRQQWFPFIGLSSNQLRLILTHAALKSPIDPLLDDMLGEARLRSTRLRDILSRHPNLGEHRGTLTRALEHFEAGDYLSCASMLFPRIEGVMRSWQARSQPGRASPEALVAAVVADPTNSRHALSPLLPQKFHAFLREVYFASFDPQRVKEVSRHTIAHGVAPEDKLTLKAALLGVLILDQIIRLLPPSLRERH